MFPYTSKESTMRARIFSLLLAALAVAVFTLPAHAGRKLMLSKGQKVYVPVYSHVYQGPKSRPYNLAALLSIRNVDYKHSITITAIKFFDDDGKLVKNYLDSPIVLPPLGTKGVRIPEHNKDGGSGANFTVRWESDTDVTVPIIQAVMIGTASTQGISFVCDGVVIEED